MALPTLTELLRPKTREGWRDFLLGQLGAAGFRVTSWPDGGTARGLVEAAAAGLADVQAGIVEVTKGGLLDLAEEGWLTLLAKSVFDVERKPSTFTEGWVTLTAAAGAGPYTITAGSFWAGQQGSGITDAKRFSATTGGTLNPSGTLRVRVRAESPGVLYNVVPGAVSFLFTPLPGVTATNLSADWPPLGGSAGADEESDTALRQRCRDKWSTLGRGATEAAYRYMCTTASPGVTRVQVWAGPGDGTLTCYCAGPAGPSSAPDIALVTAALNPQHPLTDKPEASPAVALVVAVGGTVRVLSAYRDAARTAALAALAALQASLDLGGELDLGALYATLRQPGVVDVDLTAPTGDTVSGVGSVIVLDTTSIADLANWIAV